MDSVTEVLVVGAGPTGLMLAGDLARAGLGCTVLARRAEESNLPRAFAVHARTLELLDAYSARRSGTVRPRPDLARSPASIKPVGPDPQLTHR